MARGGILAENESKAQNCRRQYTYGAFVPSTGYLRNNQTTASVTITSKDMREGGVRGIGAF